MSLLSHETDGRVEYYPAVVNFRISKELYFCLKMFLIRSYSLRPKTCTDHQNYNSCFFQLLIVTFKRLGDSHAPNQNVFSFLMTKKIPHL